jgi:hypothetical protein
MGPRIRSQPATLAVLALAATLLPLHSASAFDFRLPFFSPRSGAEKEKNRPSAETQRERSTPAPSRPTRELSDWELAHCARVAFWQDAELAPHNLQVSVEQGVATVDGPVPSEYLRKRALALLQRLRGIRGVRDHVRVRSSGVPAEPAKRHFPPVDHSWSETRERHAPLRVPPADALLPPANLTSRSEATEKPAVIRGQSWEPASDNGSWQPSHGVRAGLLPPEPAAPAQTAVGLRAPIVVPQDEHSDLARRIEDILQADPRFAQVRFSLIKKTVYLRGKLRQESHRVDLLRALEAIREIEHVRGERVEVGVR